MFRHQCQLLLRRCVAVTTRSRPRDRVWSCRGRLPEQRAWASTSRTVYLQRPRQLQSAPKASQYSFCTKAGETDVIEDPPVVSNPSDLEADHSNQIRPEQWDQELEQYDLEPYHYNHISPDLEPEQKEVHIVQVKGLPWSCSAEDLLQFFSRCKIRGGINGIHFILNNQGSRSGRAFIEMKRKDDVMKALEMDRQYIGTRYVEVFEVTECDAEAILKNVPQTDSHDGVVRLRGLSYNNTEDDIIHFFSGLNIAENGITIITDHLGRNSGVGFVQFSSQEEADEALKRHRGVIGSRYIEVFPSRKDEILSWRRAKHPAPHVNRAPPINSFSHSHTEPITGSFHNVALSPHWIHMKGLPFTVSGVDIVSFFSPLVLSNIMFECKRNGKLNGQGKVFFNSHEDAKAAMSRDRQLIGGRYIELFLNSVSPSDGR
ncbi:G-rich sequence factor 1 [Antennarius striatus]|uniref:G-rich sequence factor 1 n=1 Tax=Antennarius striatus TaxID=241820 RepID=UPI0035B197B9